jgi:hypothetical protein
MISGESLRQASTTFSVFCASNLHEPSSTTWIRIRSPEMEMAWARRGRKVPNLDESLKLGIASKILSILRAVKESHGCVVSGTAGVAAKK